MYKTDNEFKPRSKKQRDAIRARKNAERQAKQLREKTQKESFTEFKPNYSYPVRNTHIKITSASDKAFDAPKVIPPKYEGEMLERELAAKEKAKTRTVAPAYNKGPYMVIPDECVKDIGR